MKRIRLFLCVLGVAVQSSFVAGAADAPASPPLKIVGGAYLQAPSPTSMTLVWTTNKKCVSKVEYGPSPDMMSNVAISAHDGLIDADTTLHRITLKGLRPGETVHYRAISREISAFNPYRVKYGATVKCEGQFTTLDPKKEKFSFYVINDRHDHAKELRKGLGSVKWDGVDFVVALGDVMNDPTTEEQIFRNFIDPCTEFFAARIPLVFVRGNHEARGALARHLLDYFPTASGRYYYSFEHGGVHFLALDGGEDKPDGHREYSGLAAFEPYLKEETEWLGQELRSEAFRQALFRVCLLHIPPISDPEATPEELFRAMWVRDHWSPLLGKAGIDLMIAGHTHSYAEVLADKDRAFPIVVGGTETVIRVDASPDALRMTTFNDDGTVLSRPPLVPKR